MAQEIKGLAAVQILSQEDIIKEFADANNPLPLQVLSRLGFILNKDDDFAIKKEYRETGDTAGCAMLRKRLIQRYTDQPDEFTLKQFIDVLFHFNTNVKLADLLCSKCNDFVQRKGKRMSVSNSDSEMIKDIKAHLQLTCENVSRAWGKLLDETSLDKCFVAPEIVEEGGQQRKNKSGKSVCNYKELFDVETLGDRIVIEGDPGMGKTTYVNKLALDWTCDEGSEHYSDESQFLQSKFINVFVIPLRRLNGGRVKTLAQAASVQLEESGSWLSSKYHSNPTHSLLILDAFDEYDGSCPEINKIIDGSIFPRVKVIITTRPSHLEKLKIKNQWLSITGLTTPDKRERFLIRQGWDELQERHMIIYVLSSLSTFWCTPLYLAMLCVLYKAKKVTGFDPRKPNCFYVLVKLFTDHIISRKAKEGTSKKQGPQLKSDERWKLKLYVQRYAFENFLESNPWIAETFTKPETASHSEDLRDRAGQLGLITLREEQSPVTGESVESVSFIHQIFVEYYAAVQFGAIFSSYSNKKRLVKMIDDHFDLSASPFSYFLAAECNEYKEMLVKRQKYIVCTIDIYHFPWLPEILISKSIFKYAMRDLEFRCNYHSIKSFWDLDNVKEICSIAKPKKVIITNAVLGYHSKSLDFILSSVKVLEVRQCNCEHIKLVKQYSNLRKLVLSNPSQSINDGIAMLKHFPNLHELIISGGDITNECMCLLCDSLQNMNQLQELVLNHCFRSPQSVQRVIQLAKTIETSSLCRNLKKLNLNWNNLDTETESSNDMLTRAISKCVQLEILDISYCQINVQSLNSMKAILKNSPYLKDFEAYHLDYVLPHALTNDNLDIGVIHKRRRSI